MPERLLNRVAVVTGGENSVAQSLARHFLSEGAKVALLGKERAVLDELSDSSATRVLALAGDPTDPNALRELAATTTRRFGAVHIVVPAAEPVPTIPLTRCTREQLQEQLLAHVVAPLETVALFLPHLAPSATVLFLTAGRTVSENGQWDSNHAGTSALAALAQSLAAELAPRNIRVNCIASRPSAASAAADVAERTQPSARRRPVAAESVLWDDVAETAVFLASDAASQITGQQIVVGGGLPAG